MKPGDICDFRDSLGNHRCMVEICAIHYEDLEKGILWICRRVNNATLVLCWNDELQPQKK